MNKHVKLEKVVLAIKNCTAEILQQVKSAGGQYSDTREDVLSRRVSLPLDADSGVAAFEVLYEKADPIIYFDVTWGLIAADDHRRTMHATVTLYAPVDWHASRVLSHVAAHAEALALRQHRPGLVGWPDDAAILALREARRLDRVKRRVSSLVHDLHRAQQQLRKLEAGNLSEEEQNFEDEEDDDY